MLPPTGLYSWLDVRSTDSQNSWWLLNQELKRLWVTKKFLSSLSHLKLPLVGSDVHGLSTLFQRRRCVNYDNAKHKKKLRALETGFPTYAQIPIWPLGNRKTMSYLFPSWRKLLCSATLPPGWMTRTGIQASTCKISSLCMKKQNVKEKALLILGFSGLRSSSPGGYSNYCWSNDTISFMEGNLNQWSNGIWGEENQTESKREANHSKKSFLMSQQEKNKIFTSLLMRKPEFSHKKAIHFLNAILNCCRKRI